MQIKRQKNPYRKITSSTISFIVLLHIISAFTTMNQGRFLWPAALISQLLFFLLSLISYGISIRLLKKVRLEEYTPIWDWTCFALFVLINTVIIYLNILENCNPQRWAFG